MNEPRLFDSWLTRAKSSLAHAKEVSDDNEVCYEDLCYDCQQAAEKAIKAILIFYQIQFPKTHNIGYLLDLLSSEGIDIPDDIFKSAKLTDYAVTTRYPGYYEPVTNDEYLEAYHLATLAVDWVSSELTTN